MARRRLWTRRRRRLFTQAMVLLLIVAIVSLGSPTNRDTANAILIWLTVRLLIGVGLMLAAWWLWEFARPPKVKRRKHRPRRKPPTAKHRISSQNGHRKVDSLSTMPVRSGLLSDDTPPYGIPAVVDEIPATRDALLGDKMSGVRPLWTHEEE